MYAGRPTTSTLMENASSGAWKRGGGALEQFAQTPALGTCLLIAMVPNVLRSFFSAASFCASIERWGAGVEYH